MKLGAAALQLQQLLRSLPLADGGAAQLLPLIRACTSEELKELGLGPPPPPAVPDALQQLPAAARLAAVQDLISSLQYNYSPGYNYDSSKARPLAAVLATAQHILQQPLPIKCVEAVFLGLLLTQDWPELQRIPVGFKSRAPNGQICRHIVLCVCDSTSRRWGALGISRRQDLMFKPLAASSLAALVADFAAAYRRWQHTLLKVRIGLPAEHDAQHAQLPVCWRYHTLNHARRPWHVIAAVLDQHAAAAAQLQQQFRAAAAAAVAHSRGRGNSSSLSSPRSGAGAASSSRQQRPATPRGGTDAAGAQSSPRAPRDGSRSPSRISPSRAMPHSRQQQLQQPQQSSRPPTAGSTISMLPPPEADGRRSSSLDSSDSDVSSVVLALRAAAHSGSSAAAAAVVGPAARPALN